MTSLQRRIWLLLTFRGRHILEALTVALCAGDEFVLSHIRVKHVVLKTEKYISELPFIIFIAFKLTLYAIEYAFFPLAPLRKKLVPFSKLPLEEQIRYLENWGDSKLAAKRNLFKLIKGVCVCEVFSEHKLLAQIGYEDAMIARMGSRRLNVAGSGASNERPSP